MAHAGTEIEVVAFGLVKYQALKDARLVEVIIQILLQSLFGKDVTIEYGAILARYRQTEHVVNKFLPRLILDHRQ